MRNAIAGALACAVLLTATANAATFAPYTLTKTYAVGGDGGWDYLTFDQAGKRLFIPRSTRVDVFDPSSGKVTASIPNTPGVHGVALAPELGKGFTSNGRENTVTVFDTATLAETARIKLDGTNPTPDAIAYDPSSKRVFTFNGRGDNTSVIDAKAAKLVTTIKLDGKPEFAVADGKGTMFVNIECVRPDPSSEACDASELTAIDARKATVRKSWPLTGCKAPTGLAMDVRTRRLFAACGDGKQMAIVNADTGAIVTMLPIGEFCDAVAFDPATNLIFAPAFDGTLTIVHEDAPDSYSVVQNSKTKQSARTMALDLATHAIYLVAATYVQPTPAPGAPASPAPRPSMVPGTFVVLQMSAGP